MGIFSWIRRGVADAVVGGFNDGISVIEQAAGESERTGEAIRLPGSGAVSLIEHEVDNGRKKTTIKKTRVR